MDGFGKTFAGIAGVLIVLYATFWAGIAYVAYRILTHFGIL